MYDIACNKFFLEGSILIYETPRMLTVSSPGMPGTETAVGAV